MTIKQSKNNNYTGPDKVNIMHLKHRRLLGLAYLTSMYNISIGNNVIPHTWKQVNIIPIPEPNKDINIGTSYGPISLLSVRAKTLEKTLFRTSQTTSHTSPRNMASNQPLYMHSTIQHKQHHRNRLQQKQTTRTHNHSSTINEQSIRHSQHTHTHS